MVPLQDAAHAGMAVIVCRHERKGASLTLQRLKALSQRGAGPMMRPCLDCGEPTKDRRCPEHESARNIARGSPTARGYSSRWRGISDRKRRVTPWCELHYPGCARVGAADAKRDGYGLLVVDTLGKLARNARAVTVSGMASGWTAKQTTSSYRAEGNAHKIATGPRAGAPASLARTGTTYSG